LVIFDRSRNAIDALQKSSSLSTNWKMASFCSRRSRGKQLPIQIVYIIWAFYPYQNNINNTLKYYKALNIKLVMVFPMMALITWMLVDPCPGIGKFWCRKLLTVVKRADLYPISIRSSFYIEICKSVCMYTKLMKFGNIWSIAECNRCFTEIFVYLNKLKNGVIML